MSRRGGSPPGPSGAEPIPGGVHGAPEVLDFGRPATGGDSGVYRPPSIPMAEILESGPADPRNALEARLVEGPLDLDADPPPAPPRRRASSVTWALLAAVATAVIGGSVISRHSLPAEADQEPPPVAPVPASPLSKTPRMSVVSVRFADSKRGYALAAACPRGDAGPCQFGFRKTADGGRSWELQSVPVAAAAVSVEYPVTLTTVGEQGVRITGLGQRWYSPDGGRTWTQPAGAGLTPAETIPKGAPIDARCQPNCGPLRTIDPGTGQRRELKHQPGLTALGMADPLPAPSDGSRWVTGQVGPGGPPAIAVTRNDGRSWTLSKLPAPTTKLSGVAVVTLDGTRAYAFVRGTAPQGRSVTKWLDAIYLTTDGGTNWTRVDRPTSPGGTDPENARPESLLGAALLATGRLIITTEEFGRSNVRYSDDGGRTFPRLNAGTFPELGTIENSDGLLVSAGIFGGYVTSPDGTHWRSVHLENP